MSAYTNVVLQDNPVSYWRLTDPPGTALGADEMGVSECLMSSDALTLGEPGLLDDDNDTCVFFSDDLSSTISLLSNAAYNLTGDITVEAWVRLLNVGRQSRTIFGGLGDFAGGGYSLGIGNAGAWGAIDWWPGTPDEVRGPQIDDGSTHHVVAVASGTSVTFYIDSVAYGPFTIPQTATSYTGTRAIGNQGTGGYHWCGWIAHVALYSHTLSAARILIHFTTGKPIKEYPSSRGNN